MAYPYNPAVPLQQWEQLEPYFLPEDLKVKKVLDALFSKNGKTASAHSLLAAGFKIIPSTGYSGLIVVRHKKLKGYLLKIFTDNSPVSDAAQRLVWRIIGANYLREVVEDLGYGQTFKVPEKWLYPLPLSQHAVAGNKHFVLVVTDMKLVNDSKNYKYWSGDNKVTPDLLDRLYLLLQTAGLSDSIYPFNLPFASNDKIALIDTEYHHVWPIHYQRLTKFLSKRATRITGRS